MSKTIFIFSILGWALLDQGVKIWVRNSLNSTDYVELIPNFIHLVKVQNKGISFNWLHNLPDQWRALLLVSGTLVIISIMCIYIALSWAKLSTLERWGFSMILGGALGNLADRLLLGSVTDYMFFHIFSYGLFVNNLADDLISIGFVFLLVHAFFKKG